MKNESAMREQRAVEVFMQANFPRSKRKRIKKKWQKNKDNWGNRLLELSDYEWMNWEIQAIGDQRNPTKLTFCIDAVFDGDLPGLEEFQIAGRCNFNGIPAIVTLAEPAGEQEYFYGGVVLLRLHGIMFPGEVL